MENIYTVSGKFLLFGKIIGFFLLSFTGPPGKGIFNTKWHDVVALCVMLVIVSVLMVMNLLNKACVESSSVMVTNAWNISINVEIISYLVLIGYQMKNRKKIAEFLQQIAAVDYKVCNYLSLDSPTFLLRLLLDVPAEHSHQLQSTEKLHQHFCHHKRSCAFHHCSYYSCCVYNYWSNRVTVTDANCHLCFHGFGPNFHYESTFASMLRDKSSV